MSMVYLNDEFGLSTIKNFETSLGILVWWLKLEVRQNKIKIYRNEIKMHSTRLKIKEKGNHCVFVTFVISKSFWCINMQVTILDHFEKTLIPTKLKKLKTSPLSLVLSLISLSLSLTHSSYLSLYSTPFLKYWYFIISHDRPPIY